MLAWIRRIFRQAQRWLMWLGVAVLVLAVVIALSLRGRGTTTSPTQTAELQKLQQQIADLQRQLEAKKTDATPVAPALTAKIAKKPDKTDAKAVDIQVSPKLETKTQEEPQKKEANADARENELRVKDRIKYLRDMIRIKESTLAFLRTSVAQGSDPDEKSWRRGQVRKYEEDLEEIKEDLEKAIGELPKASKKNRTPRQNH